MMATRKIDLNCDMGESYGSWQKGSDQEIMEFVSSVNVACGFHAGDPATMRKTVEHAVEQGVAIGAHPGLPDIQGFGRREMRVSPEEVYEMVLYQTGALYAFVQAAGGRMQHVKPHGALYNMAARDARLAEAIANAVYDFDPGLVLYGLSGSELIRAGERKGLAVANEVFADRSYEADGTLTPRALEDAVITDPEWAVAQVLALIRSGQVQSRQGSLVDVRADTVCIHGDGRGAATFARALRQAFQREGIDLIHPYEN